MVAFFATALWRHDTLSLRTRCAAMLIGLLVVLAMASPPAVSSPGYPDNAFTNFFLHACQLGVGRR